MPKIPPSVLGTVSSTYAYLGRFDATIGFELNRSGTKALSFSGTNNLGNIIAQNGLGFSIGNTSGLGGNHNGVEVMRIASGTGYVGIGTTSPAKNLVVSGTSEFTSRTLVGGSGMPSATLQVSGSLLLAGNDNIPCTASVLGLVRRNPITGRLQACR